MIRKVGILFFAILFTALITLQSCETEVDLIAPYKSTPVIFGVLNYSADTQFVRINRTYLGNGNAEDYAQIKDSVEYDTNDVDAWLFKKDRDNKLDSIHLQHIIIPSRDPGLFYNQNVGYYYTDEPLFTDSELSEVRSGSNDLNYELVVNIKGKKYSATTTFPAVGPSTITRPVLNPQATVKLDFYSSGTYKTIQFEITKNQYTARYQRTLRINFDYNRTDGTLVEDQFIDFDLGTITNTGTTTSGDNTVTFYTENWYEFVGQIFTQIPNVQKVRIQDLEYRITGGNDIINTYIEISQPISDFTPVTNSFSNFDNDAIGILGAEGETSRVFLLQDPSLQHFNESDYTTIEGDPCYCVQNWAGSNYVCTASEANCP